MFIARQATSEDVNSLMKLARTVHFINLPANRDLIARKVVDSRKSFRGQMKDPRQRQFLFVLENLNTGAVVGTSGAMSCVSWPGNPHVYLKVGRREYWSQDLQQGTMQVTVQLGTDETGPSEIGGLVLGAGHRRHPDRLAWLLANVRFHYMGLHPRWFKKRVIAEMMGSVTPDSHALLWDYLGRRFINLSFKEADLFTAQGKEYITSLFPREELFASLLPPEARVLIGREHDEAKPARAMLEAQGFKYDGEVDPFDGGPYLEAKRDEIPLIKCTESLELAGAMRSKADEKSAKSPRMGIVSCSGEHGFRSTRSTYSVRAGKIRLPAEVIDAIQAVNGAKIGLTPEPPRQTPVARGKK